MRTRCLCLGLSQWLPALACAGDDALLQMSHDGATALAELEVSGRRQPCVLAVITELHESCDRLSEDDSGRLAVQLSNCHRWQSGRSAHPCDAATPLASCTSALAMSEADFGVYTAFRIKVDQICRFVALGATQLRAEHATEQLVRGAGDAAAAIADMGDELGGMTQQVEFSSRVVVSAVEGARDSALISIENLRGETEDVGSQLGSLLESSELALQRHAQLAERQLALRNDVLNTSAVLAAAMDEHALGLQRGWREGLAALQLEVKELIFGMLHIQSDVFAVHSIFYFIGGAAVGWALTSGPRTRSARVVWFGLLLLEWVVEQGALASFIGTGAVISPYGATVCRRTAAILGCMAVMYTGCRHVDPASLLQETITLHGSVLEQQSAALRELQQQQTMLHNDVTRCLQLAAARQHAHLAQHDAHIAAEAVMSVKNTPATVIRGRRADADPLKLSYRELQAELKRRGLKASGSTETLRLRLSGATTPME